MADVDTALREIGEATLLGRGLGAYVALLAAGARPALVRGTVLCDGPGLAGGGPAPHSPVILQLSRPEGPPVVPDPFAMAELARDVRPADYATTYARLAVEFSGLDDPITVAAVVRPPWLEAVAAELGVATGPAAAALARYASG
jgi:pimeloyl-ACP methyl ester carboxylesterase